MSDELTRGSASGWHVEARAEGGWYWHAYVGSRSNRGVAQDAASAQMRAVQALEALRADERAQAAVDRLRDGDLADELRKDVKRYEGDLRDLADD